MLGYTMSFGDSLGHMISSLKEKKKRKEGRRGAEKKGGKKTGKTTADKPWDQVHRVTRPCQSLSTKLNSLTHKHSY